MSRIRVTGQGIDAGKAFGLQAGQIGDEAYIVVYSEISADKLDAEREAAEQFDDLSRRPSFGFVRKRAVLAQQCKSIFRRQIVDGDIAAFVLPIPPNAAGSSRVVATICSQGCAASAVISDADSSAGLSTLSKMSRVFSGNAGRSCI